jgi:hypothetical protein
MVETRGKTLLLEIKENEEGVDLDPRTRIVEIGNIVQDQRIGTVGRNEVTPNPLTDLWIYYQLLKVVLEFLDEESPQFGGIVLPLALNTLLLCSTRLCKLLAKSQPI